MNEVRGVYQGTLLPPGGWLRVRTVIAHEKVRCLLCARVLTRPRFSLLL